MKINTQCVLKYLKHDYKEVGKAAAYIVVAIAVVASTVLVCVNGPSLVWPYISSYYTAYNFLNVIAGTIVVLFTFGISIFYNKEEFLVKTRSEYDDSVITIEWGSGEYIALAALCAFFPYCIYSIVWAYIVNYSWESPILSVVVFATLILIGTPIGCAIARCKEQ